MQTLVKSLLPFWPMPPLSLAQMSHSFLSTIPLPPSSPTTEQSKPSLNNMKRITWPLCSSPCSGSFLLQSTARSLEWPGGVCPSLFCFTSLSPPPHFVHLEPITLASQFSWSTQTRCSPASEPLYLIFLHFRNLLPQDIHMLLPPLLPIS